jgi:hypothetical protein
MLPLSCNIFPIIILVSRGCGDCTKREIDECNCQQCRGHLCNEGYIEIPSVQCHYQDAERMEIRNCTYEKHCQVEHCYDTDTGLFLFLYRFGCVESYKKIATFWVFLARFVKKKLLFTGFQTYSILKYKFSLFFVILKKKLFF